MSLKQRVKRLEILTGVDNVNGIIIYFKNEMKGMLTKDGIETVGIVEADYFLDKNGENEPISIEEIKKANKQYVCYLPVEDKISEIEPCTVIKV